MDLNKLKNIGEELKDLRKARGITLHNLAKELKVKSPYLDAIEKGLPDVLPADVYVLGYIKQYAKFVDVDYKPYIDALQDNHPEVVLTNSASKNLITAKEFKPDLKVISASVAALAVFYLILHLI